MTGAVSPWIRPLLVGCVLGVTAIMGLAGERRVAAPADLRTDPLAWQPIYQSGLAAFRAGDDRHGQALLAAALRRDPRAPAIRVALLDRALATGDVGAVFRQLDAIDRFAPQATAQALASLARAVDSSAHGVEIERALAPYPALTVRFLRAMVTADRPAPLIADFCRGLSPTVLANPEARALVIEQLVRAGRYGEAKRLSTRAGAPPGVITDPAFADPGALPPFGWQLSAGPFGAAERSAGGGLDVIGYGRSDGVVARALIGLSPGHSTIRLAYRAMSGDGAGIALHARCVGGGVLGMAALDAGASAVDLPVDVPAASCVGQYLDVVVTASPDGIGSRQVHLVQIAVVEESR